MPKKSHYARSFCGTVQDVLTTIKATGKTGPMAGYAVQGYAPKRDEAVNPTAVASSPLRPAHARQYDARLRNGSAQGRDLKDHWPRI